MALEPELLSSGVILEVLGDEGEMTVNIFDSNGDFLGQEVAANEEEVQAIASTLEGVAEWVAVSII